MFRRLVLSLTVILAAAIGYWTATNDARNDRVAQELRTNPDGERARKSMLVTLQDGRVYPVNFLHEGDTVFMGIDGRWWRAFQGAGQPVDLFMRGKDYRGHARVVLDDPNYVDDVFARLRPSAPAWLPRWANGKLVVIELMQ
ncbi:MAG: hypothetical protein AAF515_10180 [Pseudomonadota bacterium]